MMVFRQSLTWKPLRSLRVFINNWNAPSTHHVHQAKTATVLWGSSGPWTSSATRGTHLCGQIQDGNQRLPEGSTGQAPLWGSLKEPTIAEKLRSKAKIHIWRVRDPPWLKVSCSTAGSGSKSHRWPQGKCFITRVTSLKEALSDVLPGVYGSPIVPQCRCN